MSRPVVWFLAGMLAMALVSGGVLVGATQFRGDAKAQGTWQTKSFLSFEFGGYDDPALADAYLDGWAKALPDDCDVVFVPGTTSLIYRCPE